MIIPVYQPIGTSSHALAQLLGKKSGEKATHTGTLDPMAEGVLVVLTGDDRFKKSELSGGFKKYEFEILWGISTDSHDLLGLIADLDILNIKARVSKQLAVILPAYIGKMDQKIPHFSAKRIDGQSYFDKARNNEELPDYKQEIEIFDLHLIKTITVQKVILERQINNKISCVKGDFRQKEISEEWQRYFAAQNVVSNYFISKFTIACSKRTYIRGLVRDISHILQIPATTFSIKRTENAGYTIADCSSLV